MSSDLTLSYYYLRYGELQPDNIEVPPGATVAHCKKLILRDSKSESPASLTALYRLPEEHTMPLYDANSTLGALSVADLGPPLDFHLSMENIFGPHPEQDRLHLVLVDRGMDRL
ncbi:hypothetical protein OG21DRAFT_1486923 [Imleria badia]|nr:hypothetical protein OG21DRAFT_1486923 [Imleria badia]